MSPHVDAVAAADKQGVDAPAAFRAILSKEPDLPTGLAAIKALMEVLRRCRAGTLQELVRLLNGAKEDMKTKVDCSSVSVVSGGELFLRFITLASEALEKEDNFENMRALMLRRGEQFLNRLTEARGKIAKLAEPFLKDGARILVHSHSKCVLGALLAAHSSGRRLRVLVTESGPDRSGARMHKALTDAGIPSTLILDAAVGSVLASPNKVDCVLLGAEGVVESGGVVNKVGSYTLALCARELNKPVYVLCESFKFVRLYPLGQDDLPDEFKYNASTLQRVHQLERSSSTSSSSSSSCPLSDEHPLVDYTPPALVTLLFTDLGILTPSAVSDELIKLYL